MNRDFYHFGEGRPAVHSVAFERNGSTSDPGVGLGLTALFPFSKLCWSSKLIMAKMACPIPWACRPPPTNWVQASSGTNALSWF